MSRSQMGKNRVIQKISYLVIAALLEIGASRAASAQGASLYAVAANDGYGLQDCLAGGSECGQVVADAWCEAHGRGKALSFGPASQFSSAATKISTSMDAYVISCGE
jgi:hypothetical protein